MSNIANKKPSVLYKYRGDSSYTEQIIIDQKVWLSSPPHLNDPLECQIGKIPKNWEAKTIHELETAQILGLLVQPPHFSPPTRLFSLDERETKQWVKRFKKLSHSRKMKAMRALYSDHGIELSRPERIFSDMHDRLLSLGIFSLSETCCEELMWAHYGDQHKGLVFGFSLSDGCMLASDRHCLPVVYADKKPTFNAGFINEISVAPPGSGRANTQRISFEDKVFRSTISTKTLKWEYEKEWRYIEERDGAYNYPGILDKVVFGLRMCESRREHYKSLIKQYIKNDVEYFEVIKKPDLSGFDIKKLIYKK